MKRRVAIVGAGISGATCARRLSDAGIDVALFDKSRGVGGRMATRRATWVTPGGDSLPLAFDHGAPAFEVRSAAFAEAVLQAGCVGTLARWAPRLAPGRPIGGGTSKAWIGCPDMPAWCRQLVEGLPLQTSCVIDELQRVDGRWRLQSGGATVADGFDAVILAIPPEQAAALLQAHAAEWSAQARAIPMQPCWTLMGVAADTGQPEGWDLARPAGEVLDWVVRSDTRPGRRRVPGFASWVVHATAAWSAARLESPAQQVQADLQAALERVLGRPQHWHHATVHRWRYATLTSAGAGAPGCRWHAESGLGVCGDAWGGGGVEGAWLSAQTLCNRFLAPSSGPQARGVGALTALATV